ncbi:MAG: glycosyltransferase family 4 protein [Acidobacteriota bacterium]
MKKKIAFVVQRYGEEVIGGSESLCRAVAEHLTSFYHVDALTTCALDYYDWKNQFAEGLTECNGVQVHRFRVEGLRQLRRFHKLSNIVYTRPHSIEEERLWMQYQGPIAPSLHQHLDKTRARYAAVIFFTYLYPTTVDGITIAPERSVLVPTAHDESALYLAIYRPVFHLPKRIFYNTDEERSLVQRIFQNHDVPSEVVGVGVDVPAEVVQEPSSEPFFLYLGRVDIDKGISELTEWFLNPPFIKKTQLPKPEAYSLVVAGTPVMKLPHHPRLRLLGEISEEKKTLLLRQCRGLIVPSLYESLSLAALEAWAHGKPVIARRNSPVLEGHISANSAGLLFEDAASLHQALDQLSNDLALVQEMGQRGRTYVRHKYSWDRVVKLYRTAIEQLSEGM